MNSIHTMMSAAAALSTLAFVAFAAPPAQAGFCSVDNSSLERSCGFATLEQCHGWPYGKNGHCTLDPFSDDANAKLKAASNALAYQPKRSPRTSTRRGRNRNDESAGASPWCLRRSEAHRACLRWVSRNPSKGRAFARPIVRS